MPAYVYSHPKEIRDILQDAKPVNPRQRHSNSRAGWMTLHRGTAGSFIVHARPFEMGTEVRVLKVPDNLSEPEARTYANAHQDEFTDWNDMIYECEEEPPSE